MRLAAKGYIESKVLCGGVDMAFSKMKEPFVKFVIGYLRHVIDLHTTPIFVENKACGICKKYHMKFQMESRLVRHLLREFLL